jgi:hypothetical protein
VPNVLAQDLLRELDAMADRDRRPTTEEAMKPHQHHGAGCTAEGVTATRPCKVHQRPDCPVVITRWACGITEAIGCDGKPCQPPRKENQR